MENIIDENNDDEQEDPYYDIIGKSLDGLIKKHHSTKLEGAESVFITESLGELISTIDDEWYIHRMIHGESLKGSKFFNNIIDFEATSLRGLHYLGLASGYIDNCFDEDSVFDLKVYAKNSLDLFKRSKNILDRIEINQEDSNKYGWDSEVLNDEIEQTDSIIKRFDIYLDLLTKYTEDQVKLSANSDNNQQGINTVDELFNEVNGEDMGKVSFDEINKIVEPNTLSTKSLNDVRANRDILLAGCVIDLVDSIKERDKETTITNIYKVFHSMSPSRMRFSNSRFIPEYTFRPKNNSTYKRLREMINLRCNESLDFFDDCYSSAKERHFEVMRMYNNSAPGIKK